MMRSALLLVALAAPIASGGASPCGISADFDSSCSLAIGSVEVSAEQITDIHWEYRATACMDGPGAMAVEWTLALADVPAGVAHVFSVPTSDPACPHRASWAFVAGEGTFDSPYPCEAIVATTTAGESASWQHCYQD